ncbi:hypothetical protein [Conexibacter sp. CPCC 206217]|uniref:hypothetical protein n=1 Tax=Conexibacter sp. CPCC 206217 TaxID=3064574 RepID=UPI002728404E|nr:hypothetical protein [Conexibacter sp. CPCC 206217]MDO8211554.1 hypothetical protein [Conexibacter sp. CPCC 206217]
MRRVATARACTAVFAVLSTPVIFAGCGAEEPLPQACLQAGRPEVLQVLRGAPDRARLSDGTLLSTCIDRAEDDAELQNLGITFVAVADALTARSDRDARAAYELGFLIGAAQRGAGPTGGTQGELVQRLQQAIAFQAEASAVRSEVERGMAAGRASG